MFALSRHHVFPVLLFCLLRMVLPLRCLLLNTSRECKLDGRFAHLVCPEHFFLNSLVCTAVPFFFLCRRYVLRFVPTKQFNNVRIFSVSCGRERRLRTNLSRMHA